MQKAHVDRWRENHKCNTIPAKNWEIVHCLVVAKNVRSCKGSWGLRGKAAAIERRGNRPGNKPDKLAMHWGPCHILQYAKDFSLKIFPFDTPSALWAMKNIFKKYDSLIKTYLHHNNYRFCVLWYLIVKPIPDICLGAATDIYKCSSISVCKEAKRKEATLWL